jgi:hypothetical protein
MSIRKITVSIFVLMLVDITFITLSGFVYSRHSIPLDDIFDACPSKEGISSIDNPRFLTVAEADQYLMQNEDRTLGFVHT